MVQDEQFARTPLFYACCDGSIEIAVELMERGADVNLKIIHFGFQLGKTK